MGMCNTIASFSSERNVKWFYLTKQCLLGYLGKKKIESLTVEKLVE